MAKDSNISWCRSTWNPWIGCTKVGPGCDGCYAEALDKRMRYGGGVHWGVGVDRYRTKPSNWAQPLKWNALAMAEKMAGAEWNGHKRFWPVFCASLADVFDNEVPKQWRDDLWELIDATPNLSWLLVTKRIGNVGAMLPDRWSVTVPPHVRILITVCNQDEADRDIPKLLALKCKNGISYEPALGPIDFAHIRQSLGGMSFIEFDALYEKDSLNKGSLDRRIDWIIVGGESSQGKHKARPFNIEWARSTVRQCKAAGVPVFVKQLGSNPHYESAGRSPHEIWDYKDRAGADPAEWPAHLRVQEFPV